MNDTVKQSEGVSLDEAQDGVLLGLWRRCPDGYRWHSDYKPAGKSGGRGPWLVPTSGKHRDYSLLRQTKILADFIRLGSTDDPARMRRFAERYGMLGVQEPVVAPDRSLGFGEALSVWLTEIGELRHLEETLSAVEVLRHEQHHGRDTVNGAERLLRGRLVPAKDGALLYHVAGRRSTTHREVFGSALGRCTLCGSEQNEDQHTWRRLSIGLEVARGTTRQARWSRTKLPEIARAVLTKRITERLRGHVNLVLLDNDDGVLLRHAPDSLLAALYVQLALRVAGSGARERQCEHCRKPFFRGRRDQRFCNKQCRENAGYQRRRDRSE